MRSLRSQAISQLRSMLTLVGALLFVLSAAREARAQAAVYSVTAPR